MLDEVLLRPLGDREHPGRTPNNQYWYRMRQVQMTTVLSLLTPEYQTRMVQEAYHHANDNKPMWPSLANASMYVASVFGIL